MINEETEERCPRCDFETAITDIVYIGDWLETNCNRENDNRRLSASERELLALARQWLADDTIQRCLPEI